MNWRLVDEVYLVVFNIFNLILYNVSYIFTSRTSLVFCRNFLEKYNIVITDEQVNSFTPILELSNGKIDYSGMEVAKFETSSIFQLFYNSINIYNIKVGKDFQQFRELDFNKLSAEYSVGQYQKVFVFGEGSFGEIKGRINILDRTIDLLLIPTENFKKNSLIGMFKKHDNGGYIYNGKF